MAKTDLNVTYKVKVEGPMEPKPGYRTSEFYFVLAAVVVGMLIASGAISETSSWGKAIAFVASALTAMGYTFVRGSVKNASNGDDSPPDQ